ISSVVIGWAENIAAEVFNTPGLLNLFRRAGLGEFVPHSSWSKATLADKVVKGALEAAADGDDVAKDGLNEFVRLVAMKVAPNRPDVEVREGTHFWRLREAARSDGFDLRPEYAAAEPPQLIGVRLLPLEDPKMPLSEEITALEHDFRRLGLTVALNHYRQAVRSVVDENLEAANSQFRATLESVIVHFATTLGFTATQQGAGGAAIVWLRDNQLPWDQGGDFIRGLWKIVQTNGPHPGTTTAGEARFRMQATTAAVRFLIDRFGPPAAT
ncbi:hypothetical protein, partial [Actinomadura formosensis]